MVTHLGLVSLVDCFASILDGDTPEVACLDRRVAQLEPKLDPLDRRGGQVLVEDCWILNVIG